jgi:anti-sigma factor ChrR (cupin superfamily)
VSTAGNINGDLSVRIAVDTESMPWTPSPSRTVWRKRVHLVGAPESGQVTSIVRYDALSTFHGHEHPDGEEILVLDGVFSDEHGDWPAGTYLLNPEGFRHAPFSREGCVLFVKLRQFPGRTREHVAIRSESLPWQGTARAGVAVRPLYAQPGFADSMRLERWSADTRLGRVDYPNGAEVLVLDGSFADEEGTFVRGTWLRLPPGASHAPSTADGCVLYIKEGGFPYLRPG